MKSGVLNTVIKETSELTTWISDFQKGALLCAREFSRTCRVLRVPNTGRVQALLLLFKHTAVSNL